MKDLSQKDSLTPSERMMALKAGKPLDRVPFNPLASAFAATLVGMDRGEYYRNPEKAFSSSMQLMKRYPWLNYRPSYGWADRGAWEFGGDIVWPDNGKYPAPVSAGPVITDPEALETLADPDPKTAGMNPLVAKFNAISVKNGLGVSLPGGTPTTFAAGIVGRTEFFKWILRYPDVVHRLQQKVVRFMLATAANTIERFGIENCGVFCGVPMEANQLISPMNFEKFSKPYIQEILGFYLSKGLKNVVVHLCGDHTGNLPHWADIPLPDRSIFSIGHEMSLEKTSEFLGEKHILAGNINNTILLTGTPEQVEEEVKRCLDVGMKHPGGFLLMPACGLPPDTPVENFEAVGNALYEYGYY